MSRPAGLCLIGAGAIAERHMRAFDELGGTCRRWVVSRPEEAAREFAKRWNFANAGSGVEAAFADSSVDVVLIASPSPLHSQQAIQAMEAGKDVIIEIPMALSWPDAQHVRHIAARHRRRAWVCHTLRSTPALRLVRERITSGLLHVTHITGFFGIPRRRNQGMDGIGTRTWIDNLLWHHGCHQVDASLWVLGMPAVARVQALVGHIHPIFGMALDVGIQMTTAGGELITHALSYNVEQPVWRLQFIGYEDVLTFENGRLTNEAGQELVAQTPIVELTAQNRELLHSWQNGEACEYDLRSIVPTMEALGRGQASLDRSSDR